MSGVKIFILVVVSALLGIIQSSDLFTIVGIKPNLLLVLLISVAFFVPDLKTHALITLIGLITLRYRGVFEIEQIILLGISIGAFFAARLLRWRPFLNSLLLVVLGTVIFILLSGPMFFLNNLTTIFGEVGYNAVLGLFIFYALDSWLKTNSISRS